MSKIVKFGIFVGYVIYSKILGFSESVGYVIYSTKSEILEVGYVIEGGAIILNTAVINIIAAIFHSLSKKHRTFSLSLFQCMV